MLHFFRKIRRKLIHDSQFFKYLKYAIGEIILVVLGILIALYINNWNERRKEQDRFNEVLADVEEELEYNIFMSKHYIRLFVVRDSSYQKILIDSLKFKNYRHYNDFFSLPVRWSVRDDSFDKLNQNIVLTEEQESIMGQLKWINNDDRKHIEYYGDFMLELQKEYKELMSSYDWYGSWALNDLQDDRIVDFFQNDPMYLKMAMKDFQMITEYRWLMENYEIKAVSVYKQIYKYLDSIGTKHADTLLLEYDPKDFNHYIGKYNSKWCSDKLYVHDDSVVISVEKGKLLYTGYRSDGPDSRMEIIPIDKNHFRDNRTNSQGIYHVEFNEQGETIGIRYSAGPQFIIKMNKIR